MAKSKSSIEQPSEEQKIKPPQLKYEREPGWSIAPVVSDAGNGLLRGVIPGYKGNRPALFRKSDSVVLPNGDTAIKFDCIIAFETEVFESDKHREQYKAQADKA